MCVHTRFTRGHTHHTCVCAQMHTHTHTHGHGEEEGRRVGFSLRKPVSIPLSPLPSLSSHSIRAGGGGEILQSSGLHPPFKEHLDGEADLPHAAQVVNGTGVISSWVSQPLSPFS